MKHGQRNGSLYLKPSHIKNNYAKLPSAFIQKSFFSVSESATMVQDSGSKINKEITLIYITKR